MMQQNVTEWQLDVMKELINIGIGKGAKILNDLLDAHIVLRVPELIVTNFAALRANMSQHFLDSLSVVDLDFEGDIHGTAKLIFPQESAAKLINLLIDDTSDFDSIKASTLTEIGNIVLNSVTGSISNYLGLQLRYSVPSWHEGFFTVENDRAASGSSTVFLAKTIFYVKDFNIQGEIALIFEMSSYTAFMQILDKVQNEYFEG